VQIASGVLTLAPTHDLPYFEAGRFVNLIVTLLIGQPSLLVVDQVYLLLCTCVMWAYIGRLLFILII